MCGRASLRKLRGPAKGGWHISSQQLYIGQTHRKGRVIMLYTVRVATGQGNSRSGKSQGILEFVREIWNFVEGQGNLRKVREI